MFGCSQSTVAKIVNKLCTILVEKLSPVYITGPCRERQVLTASHFENATGLPSVIGCINGTHILIHKPSDFAVDYYTQKKIYAILVFQYSDLYQLEESLIAK